MGYYKSVLQGGTGEVIEKKSRFIATIRKVTSQEEAAAFITEMKKKYYDARHNCSAYILGKNGDVKQFSDDGEPSGTAGRPMLEILDREGIYDVAVVVTRYFGGTLLGTGGLVRAYQSATKEGLANSKLVYRYEGKRILCDVPYHLLGKMQYYCAKQKLYTIKSDYQENVVMEILLPLEDAQMHIQEIIAQSEGVIEPEELDTVEYGVVDGEVII